MKSDISFKSGKFQIFGTLYKATDEKAAALFIAGGGNIPRKDGHYPLWQEVFLNVGITTLSFDFQGVGESEGILGETNLNTRVDDARAAIEVLRQNSNTNNIYLVGTSMGGPIAIRLADQEITGLLLAVPAAYSEEARDKNFGPTFSEAIRKPESWKDSPDFEQLKTYQGKTFLIYGDRDEVIPQDIFNTYSEIVKSKGGRVIVLKNTTHKEWRTEQGQFGLDQMVRFVTGA